MEPKARGLGAGLIEESIRFVRRSGHQKLMLWTNSVLVEARRIYQKAGFRLVARKRITASATILSARPGS